jgi:hypothetical protein
MSIAQTSVMEETLMQSNIRLWILAVIRLKTNAAYDVDFCYNVKERRFRGWYCLHHKGDESYRREKIWIKCLVRTTNMATALMFEIMRENLQPS